MKKEAINFKQERNFGDLFDATFRFIGQEFKQLGTAILYFVIPFLLLSAIAGVFYSIRVQQIAHVIVENAQDPFAVLSVIGSMSGYIGIVLLLTLVSTTMMIGTIYGYIKLYVEKGQGNFSLNDVWMNVTQNFIRLFFASIVVGIVVAVGFLFCIIPGIYFWVALSIVFCIMMFEGMSFGNSFSRSMKIINKNWWFAFGALLVIGIIVYILHLIISIPVAVLGLKSIFTHINDFQAGQDPIKSLSLNFYIANSLTKVVIQLLEVIPFILTAFLYFSFVEKYDKNDVVEKTDQIGNE